MSSVTMTTAPLRPCIGDAANVPQAVHSLSARGGETLGGGEEIRGPGKPAASGEGKSGAIDGITPELAARRELCLSSFSLRYGPDQA